MKHIIILLAMALSLASNAQKMQLTLTMPSLQCKKTTENGSDEIYQLIAWKKNDGSPTSFRLPAAALWRAMKPTGLNNDLDWGKIVTFELSPGERIDILGVIMENDDGTSDMYQNFARELFRTSFFGDLVNGKTPTFQIIPQILERIKSHFNLNNADDWIGAYVCTFQYTPAGITKTYRTVINLTNPSRSQEPVPTGVSDKTTYTFAGDGSSYIAKLKLVVPLATAVPKH